jgi:hypothetical protein
MINNVPVVAKKKFRNDFCHDLLKTFILHGTKIINIDTTPSARLDQWLEELVKLITNITAIPLQHKKYCLRCRDQLLNRALE